MKTDPVIEMLRVVPGLAGRSNKELARLVPLVDLAHIRAGEPLTHQGRYEKEAFLIVDGHANVVIDGEPVADLGPGDFVGEVAMLIGGPRTATVQASTDMTLLVVGGEAFNSFAWDQDVSSSMAKQLAARLRVADNRFESVPQ
jgi:CRP-like cAMP-binding protein